MFTENSATLWRDYFVDDGGDGRLSIHFASLGIDRVRRGAAERRWRDFRAELEADARLLIPAVSPLHAVDLAGVRGEYAHTSRSTSRANHRRHTQEVILRGLRVIAEMPGARVRSVYRETSDYARDRPALYAAFVRDLNAELAAEGAHGRLVVDGNGTETALRDAHRALPAEGRYVVGDPVFESAKSRDMLQAADFIAYAAYQAIAKKNSRAFMWHWFADTFPDVEGPSAR